MLQGLSAIISQNLYIDKVCTVNLGHNETICGDIMNHNETQVFVFPIQLLCNFQTTAYI